MSSWHDDDAAAAVIVKQSGERRDETRVGDAQSTRSFRPFRSIFGTNELSFGAALISTVQEERRGEETDRPKVGVGAGSLRNVVMGCAESQWGGNAFSAFFMLY